MPRLRDALLFLTFLASMNSASATVSPRSGWNLLSGGGDLIQSGSWSCVAQVTANADDSLTIAAASSFVTPVNTTGPRLLVNGDFSVIATLSAGSGVGGYRTLVGTLSTGPNFWNGLKRLDVGVSGSSVVANYWTGDASSPTSQSFRLSAGTGSPVTRG